MQQDFVAIKEQIRNRVDLVEFVSEHVALRRQGRNYIGLCPFHQEKTPSFSVNPERQFFKCFGCGAGGDVFTFLQLRESIDFREAIRSLADRAGVALPTAGERPSEGYGRADIARINDWAATFFQKRLQEEQLGALARAYMQHRGISADSAARFEVGLAKGKPDSLFRAAVSAGFDRKLLMEAGLCKVNQERGTVYDTFRDRLMFPIRDAMRRCIGFGGRTLIDAPAKYLNTPETVLFNKSKSLYGIDLARNAIIAAKCAIVVEGYTDCLAAHQHGFCNTVATLGTAATDDHMSALRRYAETVVLVFDSDVAGEAAAERALAVGLKHNLNVRLATTTGSKDPCEYLQTIGANGFRHLLNSAVDALLFQWKRTEQCYRNNEKSDESRREAVSEFVRLVRELSDFGVLDAIQQGIITSQLSNLLSVAPDKVRSLLANQSHSPMRPVSAAGRGRGDTVRPSDAEQAALVAILEALVNEPGLYGRVADVFVPDRFADPSYRAVAERVCELVASVGEFEVAELLSRVRDTREAELVTDLVTRNSGAAGLEASLEGARNRLVQAAEGRRVSEMTEEFKRVGDGGLSLNAGQRQRLAEASAHLSRLAGGGRFAHQRAIHDLTESGERSNRAGEELGRQR